MVIIRPGVANGLRFSADVLAAAEARFEGAPCFCDHAGPLDHGRAGGRSVRDLVGVISRVHWDAARGELRGCLNLARHAAWVAEMAREFGGNGRLFGLSADMWLRLDGADVRGVDEVVSVDVVVRPAAGGRFLPPEGNVPPAEAFGSEGGENVSESRKECDMAEGKVRRVQTAQEPAAGVWRDDAPDSDAGAPPAESAAAQPGVTDLEAQLRASGLPAHLQDFARAQLQSGALASGDPAALLARLRDAWARDSAQGSIRGLGQVEAVRGSVDRLELAFERLMGLPETGAHRDVPRLTGIRELYDLLTGDYERYGTFRRDRVRLANVTTTTMANVVADVLNKVVLQAYTARPQWWRGVAYEDDFPNMQEVRWITMGGVGDLDTVAEGGPYTEKTWGDYAERSTFVKKGNYLGITLEMIDRDDVAAVRALPRHVGVAAYRTLSSAVSGLFTAAAGVGPTLADGKALFHTDHGNLGSAALDADAWDAAIVAMFKQSELHSGRRLGLRPRYCLVPIDLEKTALQVLHSETEPGGGGESNVRRYSAEVVVVPEWADGENWAAVADPAELEGVCIGYRFGRAPEIFVADDELGGAMFSHDELRIKVRFVYTVGVGDYRALYKGNIAG